MTQGQSLLSTNQFSSESADMIWIPEGPFLMGSSMVEAEMPIHEVWLEAFLLDRTPVTNERFDAFVRDTGYLTTAETKGAPGWREFASPERAGHPVIRMSWFDAKAFAEWAGLRLPSEAEWEKAARGGLSQCLFPWGDAAPSDALANWRKASPDSLVPGTRDVSLSLPNPYGLVDMAGQVWEWCEDWFDERAYSKSSFLRSCAASEGKYRVRRGGAWNVREDFRLRCANRGAMPPEAFHTNIGFRCARQAEPKK